METYTKRYYRAHEAAAYLGIGKSTFWRWVKNSKIPAGNRLSERCTVWSQETLDWVVSNCNNGESHIPSNK